MAHVRPFWTSTLQDLSNSINSTSMQGVLTPAIRFWVFGSLKGLPSFIFESVSGDLTFPSKWGCDIEQDAKFPMMHIWCVLHQINIVIKNIASLFQNGQWIKVIYKWCMHLLTRSQVTGWNPLKVSQSQVAESWDLVARSRLPILKRGRGSSWEPKD